MEYDKQRYEQLIQDSPLFRIDPEKQYTAYRRELYKMIEMLYCYLMLINEKKYEPYGCEITEVARNCIRNYDPDKGNFLHYFTHAWKEQYGHICGAELKKQERAGMKDREDLELLSEVLSDGHLVEEQLLEDEKVDAALLAIEHAYRTLQERQKPVISDSITARICPILEEPAFDQKKYTFVNRKIVEGYHSLGFLPTQRDIARKYGRNEASVSRSMKQFLDKVKLLLMDR